MLDPHERVATEGSLGSPNSKRQEAFMKIKTKVRGGGTIPVVIGGGGRGCA